ncbi:type I DNA topoisomerase [Candidatus Peribacteria bacterium]|nr:type I DNA topoisomerase [Candidatus Peribacteria bacterium]
MKHLVIVESPAKAKTIEQYLGKDYTVMSSFGHIRDLPKSGLNIDISDNFTPYYEVTADKKKVVRELKAAAKKADTVWLASDEDREGEAIAWHLSVALSLPEEKTRRIVFHEITKSAILHAIETPRSIAMPLVDAQQSRRVLDRLVGYELSPVLWKKIRTGLSAGRVQSVAVRLIVDREAERDAHKSLSSYRVTGDFSTADYTVSAELNQKLEDIPAAERFLTHCMRAVFTVGEVVSRPTKRTPAAPFTTSTLQQDAHRKFGYSVKQTMQLAQRLYEAGHITYMRTDSVNLSTLALSMAEKLITREYGKPYHKRRTYTTKSANAQEAHEAIRPTDLSRETAGSDDQQRRLYDLIRKRTLASQMADAEIERTTAHITISEEERYFIAKGEVITFEGFLAAYEVSTDDEAQDAKRLPPLRTGQVLTREEITARERFSQPPARYSEATLVKALEEYGIGRPSTYAPTISTILSRGYVEKGQSEGEERPYTVLTLQESTITQTRPSEKTGSDKGKLVPTEIGKIVNQFLVEHFGEVVDYQFTAKMEESFDEIAQGNVAWQQPVREFYAPFHALIEQSADIKREEVLQVRQLGTDPKSGRPVFVRMARFGPVVQVGTKDDEEKPVFASLLPGQSMDTLTFSQAMTLLALPRVVGTTADGQEIKANFGRFGPYVQVGSLYASIPKGSDLTPFTIDEASARALITEKQEKEANKYIKVFEGSTLQILNGHWGPYIRDTKGKKNAKLPKDITDPSSLTLAEAEKIYAEYSPKRRPKKKS